MPNGQTQRKVGDPLEQPIQPRGGGAFGPTAFAQGSRGLSERDKRRIGRGVEADPADFTFAPGAPDLAQAQESRGLGLQARAQQQGNIAGLQAEVRGEGIGQAAVQRQLQEGQEAAGRQALALAASGRGGNVGMAQRQAQVGQAAGAQAAAGQAATLQAQQQLAAQGQLTGAIEQQRAADLQAQGLDAQTALEQASLETQQQEIASGLELERFRIEQEAATAKRGQNIGLGEKFVTGGSKILSSVFSAPFSDSDIRGKTDIADGEQDVQAFLDSLEPSSFRRKDEGVRRTGIMAQDMERTPAGAANVIDTPQGKKIDATELTGTQLAALGQLNERLRSLEQMFEANSARANIERQAQPRPQPVPVQQPAPPPPAAVQPTPAQRQAAGITPAPPVTGTPPPPTVTTAQVGSTPPPPQAAAIPAPPPQFQPPQALPSTNPFDVAATIEAEEQAEADFLARQAVRRRSMLGGL